MKQFITSAIFILLSLSGFAQVPAKGKVVGQVADASGKSLEFVTLMLLKVQDSTLVKGAISTATGSYEFENVGAGRYRVLAQQLGYRKTYSESFAIEPLSPSYTVPTLALSDETRSLAEVTVVAKKPFIEQQIDRTVVNVENSIVASGGTALDVLEKAPGVTVDRQNNTIQLKGKQGVIVQIDGKQTYLSAQEVNTLLQNMPSDNLEKIEIITNPSAKYDAAGNSGIINIRLKKNKNFGTNGSLTLGTGAGYQTPSVRSVNHARSDVSPLYDGVNNRDGLFPRVNGSLNLNYRAGKINAFGTYSYVNNRQMNENTLNRIVNYKGKLTYFDQTAFNPSQYEGHSFKGGIDYFLTKKSTLGVLVNGFVNEWQSNGINYSVISNEAHQVTSRPTTRSLGGNPFRNLTGNLNYKYDMGEGREWTADADYVRYRQDSYNDLTTSYYAPTGTELLQPIARLRNEMPSDIDIYAAKTDYVHPTKKGGKWEAGVKSSYVLADNNMMYFTFVDTQKIPDPTRSNRFKYNENINAAYLNWNGKLNKKTQVQLGLRVENTHAHGNSVTLNQEFTRDYTNLFPSAFISRQLDSTNTLNLSYSRRIQRPDYQMLNPFVNYLDPFTYQQGNPNLRPQYSHSVELTHVYKSAFNTTIGYSHTTDVIVGEVPNQIAEKNITYITAQNLATQNNLNLTFSFPVSVTKWWTMQNNLTVYHNRIETEYLGGQYNVSFTAYNAYSSNSFKLPNNFSAELSAWYNSAGVYGFFKSQPMGAFSVGLQKQLMNKKATLRLNVNDPFWWNQFRGSTNYQDINFKINSRWMSRQARITFTYRFGNQNVKSARQRQSATSAEQGRVGGTTN